LASDGDSAKCDIGTAGVPSLAKTLVRVRARARARVRARGRVRVRGLALGLA
jgi:hypothetical protein